MSLQEKTVEELKRGRLHYLGRAEEALGMALATARELNGRGVSVPVLDIEDALAHTMDAGARGSFDEWNYMTQSTASGRCRP